MQVAAWHEDRVEHPSASCSTVNVVQIYGEFSKPYVMQLIPLSKNTLAPSQTLVNIPGSIPAFFPDDGHAPGARNTSIWSATFSEEQDTLWPTPCSSSATPFPDLHMGVVLGSGSFARVFFGTYKGQQVAVKVKVSPVSCEACLHRKVVLQISPDMRLGKNNAKMSVSARRSD